MTDKYIPYIEEEPIHPLILLKDQLKEIRDLMWYILPVLNYSDYDLTWSIQNAVQSINELIKKIEEREP